MSLVMGSSPHTHNQHSVTTLMSWVIIAMIPAALVHTYYFGYGFWVQALLASITALASETAILAIRGKAIKPRLMDGSALLTGLLLAISIPAYAPWWVIVIGTWFAITFVKQLYGGLGFNLFNPAMAGYVLLLISFPVEMTQWPATVFSANAAGSGTPGVMDSIALIFGGFTLDGYSYQQLVAVGDAFTGATQLDEIKTALANGLTVNEIIGSANYSHGYFAELNDASAMLNLAFLAGGMVLIYKNVVQWHIPVSFLAALGLLSLLGVMFDASQFAGVSHHLLSGATMIGAFFILTDPVSASTTAKGRLIYGALIGLTVYVIRTFGGYPDAVAFAVLIINMAVPLIDAYTRPRSYGEARP